MPRHLVRVAHHRPLLLGQPLRRRLRRLPEDQLALALHHLHPRLAHSALHRQRRVVHPFVPRLVDHGNARNSNLAQVGREQRLGAHGAEERVPAVCHGGRMKEGEVERLEGPRGSAGADALDDGGVLGGGGGRGVGDVGQAHFADLLLSANYQGSEYEFAV
ncbi:hypothetical protein VTI74DRAFT_5865 [Chaetomium olivicolor]